MEVILASFCGVMAWTCAFLLLGGLSVRAGGQTMRLGRCVRAVERTCSRIAGTHLVGWLSSVGPWRQVSDALARRLAVTGMLLAQPSSSAALLVACVLTCVILAVISWSPLGLATGVVACAIAVASADASMARRRRLGLSQEMPGVFRTLAVALGSGQTMPQAIEHLGSRQRGYAAESFSKAALMLRCGSSVEEALGSIERELSAPGVSMLTTALRVSHRTGSPLHDLLMRSARLVERTSEFERLLSVKTAQVRLSVRIVCTLPAALVALLATISPDFRAGLATPTGLGCLIAAASMDGLALLIVRRLVREVL